MDLLISVHWGLVSYLRGFLHILGYNSGSHDFPIKRVVNQGFHAFFWLLSMSLGMGRVELAHYAPSVLPVSTSGPHQCRTKSHFISPAIGPKMASIKSNFYYDKGSASAFCHVFIFLASCKWNIKWCRNDESDPPKAAIVK